MKLACPACGSTAAEPNGEYRGSHAAFRGLHRARCLDCRMVFATPMPDRAELDQYNASYFASAHGGKPQGPATLAFFSGIAGLRLAYLEDYLRRQGLSVTRVLEIGPGPGWFARGWLSLHPGTTYAAVETDTSCHDALRQLGVDLVQEDADAGVAPVDLVVMTHVLEHVTDPVEFLRATTRDLRSGGALFIEVPCRDWEHKQLDEPHLLFFDKEPMRRLLQRLGFEQVEVTYHGRLIEELRQPSRASRLWHRIRAKVIALGVVGPFGRPAPGLETLSPLERAAVRPHAAHLTSEQPAWWLRAVARKT